MAESVRLHEPSPGRDGLITNDKFCLSRFGRLRLSWWRLPLRLRGLVQANGPSLQTMSAAGGNDAAVAGAPRAPSPSGRAAPVGSGLSANPGLDPTRERRRPRRPPAPPTGGEP